MLKIKRLLPMMLLCSLVLTGVSHGAEEEPGAVPAVKRLDVAVQGLVFDDATRSEPLEFKSADDAKKYFSKDQFKALNKAVDWDKQDVLVFAWHGSGQDKLAADVKEKDDGLLVDFVYTPGRTRDLRPHTYVFAVRKGVAWQAP